MSNRSAQQNHSFEQNPCSYFGLNERPDFGMAMRGGAIGARGKGVKLAAQWSGFVSQCHNLPMSVI